MKEKYILTDCDGVCLDWETAFMGWCKHNGMVPVEGHQLMYKVNERFGVSPEEGKRLTSQFNSSAAIGFLPPLRDAQWYIRKLHEQHGFKFVAVTSLHSDPYAQQLRTQNLKKLFGDAFVDFHYLDCGADKDEILLELSHKYNGEYYGVPWIEDKPVNADVGASCGFSAILMEHGHNMDYEGPAEVVKNWEQIYQMMVGPKFDVMV